MQNVLNGVARLTQSGLIRAQGEDAAKFLQGQLTNDFDLLGLNSARLAGFCNAKGRMQASFIGFKRSPTDIFLVCSRDILATTLKRLSIFVMRAKIKLSDVSDEFSVVGLAGDAALINSNMLALNAYSAWSKADSDTASCVCLYPADGVARVLWIAPLAEPVPQGKPLSEALWAWGEVRSGIATVTAPVVDTFVPQMLNYESVGGVNFKKGCYPGQEVVARSQFRGTLKRRAYLAHSKFALQAGDALFSSTDASQPCGTVVQAAKTPGTGFDAIVSMQITAFELGAVKVGASDGPTLELAQPPYPLLADI